MSVTVSNSATPIRNTIPIIVLISIIKILQLSFYHGFPNKKNNSLSLFKNEDTKRFRTFQNRIMSTDSADCITTGIQLFLTIFETTVDSFDKFHIKNGFICNP